MSNLSYDDFCSGFHPTRVLAHPYSRDSYRTHRLDLVHGQAVVVHGRDGLILDAGLVAGLVSGLESATFTLTGATMLDILETSCAVSR